MFYLISINSAKNSVDESLLNIVQNCDIQQNI